MIEGQERQDSLNHLNSVDIDIEDNYKSEEDESNNPFDDINPSLNEFEDIYLNKANYISLKKKIDKKESLKYLLSPLSFYH